MLKKRIVANLVVRNGIIVQSINFKKFLPIGDPGIAIDFLNQWGVDEIILTAQFAQQSEEMGAGEILINSVEKDGSYEGYDIDLIKSVCDAVSIPVICLGGAKNANDMAIVFEKTKVSAAAAANFFHFTE